MPIDRRIVASLTPIASRSSFGTPEWVVLAGCEASDSVPPRLTASLKICSAFSALKAAALPPFTSKEKVEPGPEACALCTRAAAERGGSAVRSCTRSTAGCVLR